MHLLVLLLNCIFQIVFKILQKSYSPLSITLNATFLWQFSKREISFFLPLLKITNAVTLNDPTQSISGVYHDNCNNAVCQTHSSQKATREDPRNFDICCIPMAYNFMTAFCVVEILEEVRL